MKNLRLIVVAACVATALVAGTTQLPAFAGHPDVEASFSFSPVLPVTGETVTFTSTSTATGARNQIEGLEWDLDDDGSFDDRQGSPVSRAFVVPGTYTIRLRVTGRQGASDVATQVVAVQPPAAKLLKPFPVVRLTGKLTRKGVRVRRLSVNAPKGTQVVVRCTGRRCPLKRQSRSSRAEVIQIRGFDGRLLRAGTKLRVYATQPALIGKYTRFKIIRFGPPRRIDRCMIPGRMRPARCPS